MIFPGGQFGAAGPAGQVSGGVRAADQLRSCLVAPAPAETSVKISALSVKIPVRDSEENVASAFPKSGGIKAFAVPKCSAPVGRAGASAAPDEKSRNAGQQLSNKRPASSDPEDKTTKTRRGFGGRGDGGKPPLGTTGRDDPRDDRSLERPYSAGKRSWESGRSREDKGYVPGNKALFG